jgi:hypothetical protein
MRLLLAALSGLLSSLSSIYLPLPSDYGHLLEGGVFGALVLVPFVGAVRWRIGRAIVLVAGGMAINFLAINLAIYLHDALAAHEHLWTAITPSGLFGALLVAALTQVVAPLRAGWKLWAYVSVAGIAGGLLFSLPPVSNLGDAVPIAGYVGWQVLVCAALYFGSERLARDPGHSSPAQPPR